MRQAIKDYAFISLGFIVNIFNTSIAKNDLISIIINNKDLLFKYWYATKYIYKTDKNIDIEIDKKICV